MSAVFYGDQSFRIQSSDAQRLAVTAAHFNASGQQFTVRITGSSREDWLIVNGGIPFRVTCGPISVHSDQYSPRTDRITDVIRDADLESRVVMVRTENID